MATANKNASPKAPTPLFQFDTGFTIPEVKRGGAAGGGSEIGAKLKAMPMQKAWAKTPENWPSFFTLAKEAGPEIEAAAERDQVAKDNARKLASAMGGQTRRITKADATYNFAVRTVTENGKIGVRVWRIPAEA